MTRETKREIRADTLEYIVRKFGEESGGQYRNDRIGYPNPDELDWDKRYNAEQVYWILKYLDVVPDTTVNFRGNVVSGPGPGAGGRAYHLYKQLANEVGFDVEVPTNVTRWYGYSKEQLEEIRAAVKAHERSEYPSVDEIEERIKELDPDVSDARAKSEAKRLYRHETSKRISFSLDDIDVEVRRTARVSR